MRQLDIAKIERKRLDLGIAKKRFCRENGICIKTYNRLLENPAKKVNDATIFKLAKALDIPPSELVSFPA